jgi:hypothetical protein
MATTFNLNCCLELVTVGGGLTSNALKRFNNLLLMVSVEYLSFSL